MRLLFLSNEFPNQVEPMKATFNYDLLTALAAEHDVTAISPISWWDEVKTRLREPAKAWVTERQIGRLTVKHPRFFYTPGRLRHWYGDFLWWSLKPTVAKILRGPKPDCVFSYWAHPDGDAAVRLARKLGVPSIVMVGGSDVLLVAREPRRGKCIADVLRNADAVMAVSRDLAEKVAAMGVSPDRIHVMRRGVDETLFHPGDRADARRQLQLPLDRRLILWVGRMVPVKGLDVLLAACSQLKERMPDFQLLLVGDGPLRASLEAEVRQRGLSDHVRFVGSVDHDRLGPWFRAADLTVLPSRSEGIPNVLLESLACGTPFVASAVGGVPEIAGHDAARLVPSERPELLAAELERTLVDRPQVAEAHRPHTLRQFAGRVAALAESLIAARRGGNPARHSRDTGETSSHTTSTDESFPVQASRASRSPHFASSPESVVHP